MNREDICRMAEEAGFGQCTKMLPLKWMGYDEAALTKFAQLVAAHEREECAKLSDMLGEMLAKDHPMHATVALTIGIKIRARK